MSRGAEGAARVDIRGQEQAILGNREIEVARTYHALTKHSYASVRSSAHYLDWQNRPFPYKLYPEVAGLALPRDLSLARLPALEAVAADAEADSGGALTLEALTRILFCADGLTRRRRVGGEDYHFRAAPSAGALYPIEVYVAVGEAQGLEPGLYHFSPADLRLRGLRRGDWRSVIAHAAGGRRSLRRSRAIVLLSAIFWRSAWKYRARAYRYCLWDAGTMLANLLASATAEGFSTELVSAFSDSEIETLLGIDGEREGAMCLVALGDSGAEPISPAPSELTRLALDTIPLSAEEVSFPDLVRMHQASRLIGGEEIAAAADRAIATPHPELSAASALAAPAATRAGSGLGETILRRGSTRVFAREPMALADLAAILGASSRHPRADFPALSETYLIANAIDGLSPGAYYHRRATGEFVLLKPGNFRGEAGYLCLEQPLGADCSALLCYMADLERALDALGNRGYRDAHLEAGLHGGRAYLAAYALGHGATGLTFYDDDTTEFFSPPATGLSPLLMVALGVPRSRADEG